MLKKLISYNVHQPAPQTHARTKGKGLWLVKMHVRNHLEEEQIEMRNLQPIDLLAMLPLVLETLTEAIGELSPVVDAGFTVYQHKG